MMIVEPSGKNSASLTSETGTPLSGIRVLDFGHHRAGPHCALVLARMGAEVIKIEECGGEQLRKHGIHWAQENNTKKSVTLNLRRPEALQVAYDLVAVSDVLVQNFRPGVMEKLGLGYETLSKINPKIIVVNVSAYGASNVNRLKPGFDGLMQSLSGLMYLNGEEQMIPMKTHPAIVDRVAGLHAAVGTIAALYERERSGKGQTLDVALLSSAYSIGDAELASTLVEQKNPKRRGNRAGGPPINNAFRAVDGWVFIATGGREGLWQKVCEVIGKKEWLSDPRFSTKADRIERADEIEAAVQAHIDGKPKQQVVDEFAKHGVPIGPVRTPREAVEDTYPFDRSAFVWLEGVEKKVPVTGDMWHFSRSKVAIGSLPEVGEHIDTVLRNTLHYTPDKIEQLRKTGIFG